MDHTKNSLHEKELVQRLLDPTIQEIIAGIN